MPKLLVRSDKVWGGKWDSILYPQAKSVGDPPYLAAGDGQVRSFLVFVTLDLNLNIV